MVYASVNTRKQVIPLGLNARKFRSLYLQYLHFHQEYIYFWFIANFVKIFITNQDADLHTLCRWRLSRWCKYPTTSIMVGQEWTFDGTKMWSHDNQIAWRIVAGQLDNNTVHWSRVFLKENVRYSVWTCRDPKISILGTLIGSLKHLNNLHWPNNSLTEIATGKLSDRNDIVDLALLYRSIVTLPLATLLIVISRWYRPTPCHSNAKSSNYHAISSTGPEHGPFCTWQVTVTNVVCRQLTSLWQVASCHLAVDKIPLL